MAHISLRSTFAKLIQLFIINNALSQSGIYSSDVRWVKIRNLFSQFIILRVQSVKHTKRKHICDNLP